MVLVKKDGKEYQVSGVWMEEVETEVYYGKNIESDYKVSQYVYCNADCGNSAVGWSENDLFRPSNEMFEEENGRFMTLHLADGVEIIEPPFN